MVGFTVKVTLPLDTPAKRVARAMPQMREIVGRAALTAWRTARLLAPVDRGALRQSIIATQTIDGLSATVGPGVAWAPWVEFGRKPGERQPPTEALLRWGRIGKIARALQLQYRAGLATSGWIRGRARLGRTARSFRSFLEAAAFLVARAIRRRGIAPRPFMAPAAAAAQATVDAGLARFRID